MASDPLVKAIVVGQAVPGTAASIDKVRETRPDMLFICGVVAEDPAVMAEKADINTLAVSYTHLHVANVPFSWRSSRWSFRVRCV